jgi:hypothetical protein
MINPGAKKHTVLKEKYYDDKSYIVQQLVVYG